MKFLLVIAVLVAAYYVWRAGRRSDAGSPPAGRARPGKDTSRPQDMVQCASCAVHLPRTEALPGRDGAVFCSDEHRRRHER